MGSPYLGREDHRFGPDTTGDAVRLDDLTRVYNPLKEDFVWTISGIEYICPAEDYKTLPRWACRLLAKHLTDKILQEKHGVKDTNSDTPVRRSVLATILVDEAAEKKIVVTEEEVKASIKADKERAKKMSKDSKSVSPTA